MLHYLTRRKRRQAEHVDLTDYSRRRAVKDAERATADDQASAALWVSERFGKAGKVRRWLKR